MAGGMVAADDEASSTVDASVSVRSSSKWIARRAITLSAQLPNAE